jgi:hypothetical protein
MTVDLQSRALATMTVLIFLMPKAKIYLVLLYLVILLASIHLLLTSFR